MKILHTADLHLQEKNPETMKTLELILTLAKNQNVDLLTIAGDLFDSPQDAENLRTRIRRLFSNLDFPIIAIPGNHDERVFKGNLDFGTNFYALINKPVECYTLDIDKNVNIVGIPFTSRVSDELLTELAKNRKTDALNILLLHCTLDISFSKDDFGEREKEYFEIDKSTLKALNYDFILAGHFHTKFDRRELSSNCTFVYPGSPVSITWKEIGERAIALLDTSTRSLSSFILEGSFCRDILNVKVFPDEESNIFGKIEDWVNRIESENGEFKIIINGYGKMDEISFSERLEKIRVNIEIENNYINVTKILEHPLYQRFQEEIQQSDSKIERESLEQVVIQAMGDVIRRED